MDTTYPGDPDLPWIIAAVVAAFIGLAFIAAFFFWD